MRRLIILFLLFIPLMSCQNMGGSRAKKWSDWMDENGKLKVLTTTAMINDIVRGIAGDHVNSMPLIEGELDPHSYEPVKGDHEKFSRADVIFFNGLNLEHGPSLEKFLHGSKKAYSVGDPIKDKYEEKILYLDGAVDPHIWMDMSLWSETIPTIASALAKYKPEYADEFYRNANSLKKHLEEEHASFVEIFSSIPEEKRYLVTSHDAFGYFTRAYLIEKDEENDTWRRRCQAPEGLAPEGQLSASDIRFIVEHLKKYQIHAIFPESNVNPDALKKILDVAEEEGLFVELVPEDLYGDSMGDGSYEEMIRHNVQTIAENLKKNGS